MSTTLSLTEHQLEAVNSRQRSILLIAPAGSGKTEVLVRRLERIMLESSGAAFRALAVTYTVKSAEEIRARIRNTIAGEAWRVDCNTLHGFALEWLSRYGSQVGVNPDVVVYSDDVDRLGILAEYMRTLGLGERFGENISETIGPGLKAVDDYRTRGSIEAKQQMWLDGWGMTVTEICDAYATALSQVGGIDFPGMLSKLIELLEIDPWVLQNFRTTYNAILVDEGQDLTFAQTQLLKSLVGDEVDLFVVADDRQSINAYAGGSFANALALVGPSASRIRLPHNFRSATQILDAAERVARPLESSQEPASAPGAPSGQVIIQSAATPEDEALQARSWIQAILEHGLDPELIAAGEDRRIAPEEVAVIARARWLLDPLVAEMTRSSLTFSMSADVAGFLVTRHGRVFFNALSVLADAGDRPARRRLADELGDDSMPTVEGDPIAALTGFDDAEVAALVPTLQRIRSSTEELDSAVSRLSEIFHNTSWQADAQVVEQLWLRYRAETHANQRSLRAFLRYSARIQLTRPEDPGVRLLTIHKVKGLQFKVVLLIAAYDGALPDYRARTDSDLDSERRSLYVAMTRARRILRISWPSTTRDRYNRTHSQLPSRFLREAGLARV